jgi:hypothetical protein
MLRNSILRPACVCAARASLRASVVVGIKRNERLHEIMPTNRAEISDVQDEDARTNLLRESNRIRQTRH